MPRIVEYFQDERLHLGLVEGEEKQKLKVLDGKGRVARISQDRVVFVHQGASVAALSEARDALAAEVDVDLLWETAREEAEGRSLEASALAVMYFDSDDPLHASAVYKALSEERVRFRKKGRAFTPRSPEDMAQLREQQAAETVREAELAALTMAVKARDREPALLARLERWLRGLGEPLLGEVLEAAWREPAPEVFGWLVEAGHLAAHADLEVIQANLRGKHPPQVLAHAEALSTPPHRGEVLHAAFSIDDPDTREVDDVLTFEEEGDHLRVHIDIADVAAWVTAGDPVDSEAARRASTAYLPTGALTMLPERLGCDLASLHPDRPRPALRLTVRFDPDGKATWHRIAPVTIAVARRLSYDEADGLLAEEDPSDPTAKALARGCRLAAQLAAARRAEGAFSMSRTEWKVKVSAEGDITIGRIPPGSPSRQLVAEMMILTNRLSAQEAASAGVPIIYRVQPRPTGTHPMPDPDDPLAFEKLRGLLLPASLSLQPGWHHGLGVPTYTQISSPLRRYADLACQRQLTAALTSQEPPHGPESLLKILASAEHTERELKRVEVATTQRWTLEWIARQPTDRLYDGLVLSDGPGAPRVLIEDCGARGLLSEPRSPPPGTRVRLRVSKVLPHRGLCRLVLAGS